MPALQRRADSRVLAQPLHRTAPTEGDERMHVQGDALVEGGAAKLADFGLSRIVGGGNGGAVRAPASNPFRNSGSGSLDMTPPSDLASPPSSNASWVGQVHAFDEEDLDVAAVDEMLVPRARDSAAPASLQAYASSPGGELATPGPTASASAPPCSSVAESRAQVS